MPDDKTAQYTPPTHPPSDGETRPLPEGWIKQFDPNSNAWFYVDTRASPPRSIWVHPYDDPQYLERHPHMKDHDSYDSPPEYRGSPSPPPIPSSSHPNVGKGKGKEKKRGLLGQLKDRAIGTKEERREAKRLREQERRERLALQREHAVQYGAPPQMYPGQYQQYQPYPDGRMQPPMGYQQGYGQPMYAQQQPRRGFGGGGAALPLLGGLAGGLLLGDIIGGGFGDGGDFGGGDFGGGF